MKNTTHFILIDDERICNVLTSIFINEVYSNARILTFTHPAEAIAFLKTQFIVNPVKSIVFVDINMPQISGWQVLDMIAELPKSITGFLTIFILSSSIDPADKEKAKGYPLITDFIEKPVTNLAIQTIFNNNTLPIGSTGNS